MNNQQLSYSMFIDNKPQSHNSVQPRKLMNWVQDDAVKECYQCKSIFTFLNRRHHCRACGRIFCGYCTHHRLKLPKDRQIHKLGSVKWRRGISEFLQQVDDSQKERVCDACFRATTELKEVWKTVNVFDLVGFDYGTLRVLSRVNSVFRKAAMVCISGFRELQYALPNHHFSPLESGMLWNNRRFLAGHSQWLYQFLRSLRPSSMVNEEMNIIRLLNSPKNLQCWSMMCTRNCKKKLEPYDIVGVLISQSDLLQSTPTLNKKLLQLLSACISIEELICYLSILFELIPVNPDLRVTMIEICKRSVTLRMEVYWHLTYLLQQESISPRTTNIYSDIRQQIHDQMDNKEELYVQGALNFVCNVTDVFDKPIFECKKKLRMMFQTYKNKIHLPFDIHSVIRAIDYDGIQIKSSSTQPLMVPLECFSAKTQSIFKKNIIVKKENLRRDKIIINIIRLMDRILKKDLGLDCDIMTYDVLPFTTQIGLIETISDANTIYDVTKKHNMSILNYILEHNTKDSVQEVRQKFTRSTAAYCVICYLLGIGDRHLDNIMISNSGKLFHIDYGYILGDDPKLFKPQIRIIPEMIDALGGTWSHNYQEFEKICSRIYDCLRSHINVFMYMIGHLSDVCGVSREAAEKEVITRFMPGQGPNEAKLQFRTIITNSRESRYQNGVVDFLHYHNKENTLSTLSSSTYDWIIYLYQNITGKT